MNSTMDDLLIESLNAQKWGPHCLFVMIHPTDQRPESVSRVMQLIRKHGWICTIWPRDDGFPALLVSKFEPDPPEPPPLRAVRKKP